VKHISESDSRTNISGCSQPLSLLIKTLLQNAPRDADKLERLLRLKERQKDEAMYMEKTERLVTEIEMLKVVLYLVMRNR
jgi:hypothetical protein